MEKFQNFVKYLGLSYEQGYIDIYIYECMDLYVYVVIFRLFCSMDLSLFDKCLLKNNKKCTVRLSF